MKLRAWCAAGLLTAAAGAQEAPKVEGHAVVSQAIAASYGGSAPVVRWDGQPVAQDDEVRGLRDAARETIETWRRFAQRRGYRVDLDESQRVLVISDAERFESFASSERVIDKTLRQLEAFKGLADSRPVVLLRAKSARDATDASSGASKLGVDVALSVFVESGSHRDVRSVQARLSEAMVLGYLAEHQPFLSEWMTDGLASLISEEATGRALVDGKAVSLRSVLHDVSSRHRRDKADSLDLFAVSGAGTESGPQEAEAMAVMSFLSADLLERLVPELGQRSTSLSESKVRLEEEALLSHMGQNGLRDLQRRMVKGR